MGCCLSTDRATLQGGSGSNIQSNEQGSDDEHAGPRLIATQSRQQDPTPQLISNQYSRRRSRQLEYESQRQLEAEGLRLDQRVTRPLVMHKWSSKTPITREELTRRRDEYYDTRVTGRTEVWRVMRLAIETMENGDFPTAQEIINASGITIPTGNLIHGAYDERGIRYELPEYCVSAPSNLITTSSDAEKHAASAGDQSDTEEDDIVDLEEIERRRELKGKMVLNRNEKKYRVVARLSDRGGPGSDVAVIFQQKDTVRTVIRKIIERGKLDPKAHRLKIAYLGKILNEHESLPEQGWVEGNVINALVFQQQRP
ncbi:hypothetical protein BDZ91DRAFT_273129 [Kalaharituber pfeilii]|nr:hypothetical protein BDZ91DRAFT_273129 [Kalaharituber pfeilii]